MLFNDTITPSTSSGATEITVQVPRVPVGRQVHFRVYAYDGSGNLAMPSNIASVRIAAIKDDTDNSNNIGGLPAALFWVLIGLGIACFLLVVALAAFFCYRRRQKNMAAKWVEKDATTEIAHSPIQEKPKEKATKTFTNSSITSSVKSTTDWHSDTKWTDGHRSSLSSSTRYSFSITSHLCMLTFYYEHARLK